MNCPKCHKDIGTTLLFQGGDFCLNKEPIDVEMEKIGTIREIGATYAGEEDTIISLYQCPVCKYVRIQ